MSEQLSVVVEQGRTRAVVNALRAEGIYDDERSITGWAAGTVAVPVTRAPRETRVLETVVDESTGRATLDDLLAERDWTETERERAPSSWAVVGDVVLVRAETCPRPTEFGKALLALVGGADTVLARHGSSGPHREPDIEVLAGEGDTETVHHEHGITYALDLSEVMFAPGSRAERVRTGELVEPGERVLDSFAGIGYFTLPMARGGATVTAVERNPAAFAYLVENVVRNELTDCVETYRADCRDVIEASAAGTRFDRVCLGHYDAHEYLTDALAVLPPGGVAHVHATTPGRLLPERPARRVNRAVDQADRSLDSMEIRRVKTYSEGVVHVVVDLVVG